MTLQRSHIFLTEALTFIAVLLSFLVVGVWWLGEPLEDAPPTGIGGAELDLDPVARQDADRLEARLAGRMAENPVAIVQLDPVERVRKGLDDPSDQGLSHVSSRGVPNRAGWQPQPPSIGATCLQRQTWGM
jgi:hypothetical protein